jgi:hypothetical protein
MKQKAKIYLYTTWEQSNSSKYFKILSNLSLEPWILLKKSFKIEIFEKENEILFRQDSGYKSIKNIP